MRGFNAFRCVNPYGLWGRYVSVSLPKWSWNYLSVCEVGPLYFEVWLQGSHHVHQHVGIQTCNMHYEGLPSVQAAKLGPPCVFCLSAASMLAIHHNVSLECGNVIPMIIFATLTHLCLQYNSLFNTGASVWP